MCFPSGALLGRLADAVDRAADKLPYVSSITLTDVPISRASSMNVSTCPPFAGPTGGLNSEPLGPGELRRRVVPVNFWTLTCINRLRHEPYVRVISAVSAPLLEQGFAEGRLGYREDVLFTPKDDDSSNRSTERATPLRRLFPGYSKPLPDKIQTLVLARAGREAEITTVGKALFLYCDAKVRQNPDAAPVLATFLNIYGFARNACLASAIGAVLLAFEAVRYESNADTKAWLAVGMTLAAVGLLYRYLKFFRLYAREVFLFYATEIPGVGVLENDD